MADGEWPVVVSSNSNNNSSLSSSSSSQPPLPLVSGGTAGSAVPLFRGTVDEWLVMAVTRAAGSAGAAGAALFTASVGLGAGPSTGAASSSLAICADCHAGVCVDASLSEWSLSSGEPLLPVKESTFLRLGFLCQFLESHGLDTRSTVSFSIRRDFFLLHLITVHDGNVVFQSPSAEDLSRRILLQIRAKNPDFVAPLTWIRDGDEALETVAIRALDRYVTETQKTLALFEEQERIRRAEVAAYNKKRDKKDGRDKIDCKGCAGD